MDTPKDLVEEMGEDLEIEQMEVYDLYEYAKYPFAMELSNGYIINLSCDLQGTIRQRLLEITDSSEEELLDFLLAEDREDVKDTVIGRWLESKSIRDHEQLADILGFDWEDESFSCDGIGFLGSRCGYVAKSLLEIFGYSLSEKVDYDAQGHEAKGVKYLL